MQSFVTLRKTGSCWEFESEEALEDFLFSHLDAILGWTVIQRQYIVNNQRCDILATDKAGRLVVIELKNVEDRGIVQQLTRYYHALLEDKPFGDRIDYDKPVNLVAIAPSFHRDNLIDRQYHQLEFEFFQFSIEVEDNKFYLILKDIDSEITSQIQIFYEEARESNLPCQPQRLRKFMTDFEPNQKETILRIREKILSFDSSIQEVASVGSIKYGNGTAKNSKYCAEFLLDKKYSLVLFLWIPFKGGESSRIGRARIWSDWNYQALVEGYISSGIGLQINKRKKAIMDLNGTIRTGREWKKLQLEDPTLFRYNYSPLKSKTIAKYEKEFWNNYKKLKQLQALTYEDVKLLEDYSKFYEEDKGKAIEIIPSPYKNLDSLIDLALEKWLERV